MIGERIIAVRGKTSREAFATEVGVHPQTLARYEKGERLPDSAFVENVSKRFGVSPAWLLTGSGTMHGAQNSCDVDYVYIELVEARLSAGTGSFVTSAESVQRYAFRSDWINSKGQPAQMVLMRVDGDSMEPEIHHGDMVLIDQSQTAPRAGAMFAVGVEDVVYIKMVDTKPGSIVLKSHNGDAYPPLTIDTRGQLEDGVRIVGKAVWLGRELR